VIHFAAWVNLFSVFDFKECDALAAALEEALPRALVFDVHAEEIDVKLPCPREILDVEDHVVDAGNLQR
jgi:hypothetical protein